MLAWWCSLLLVGEAAGALQWETELIELEAPPLAQQAVATFRFKNTGDKPVTIAHLHASCGCTTPALEKREYAPGESGEVTVTYTFGDAVGQQEKLVSVVANEPEPTTYQLRLRVTIPELLAIQPRFVMWRQNEEPVAKTITIHALRPDLVRPVSVEARDARFSASLHESEEEPGTFTVTIAPESTDATMFTTITVATSAPEEHKRVIQLFATVR